MVVGCVPCVVSKYGFIQAKLCRWGSGSYSLDNVVPPIDAITGHIGNGGVVTSSLSNDIKAAVAAAKGKDVAIVFANAWVALISMYLATVNLTGLQHERRARVLRYGGWKYGRPKRPRPMVGGGIDD